jgi:fumarylpyruvate hydrolase
VSYLFAPPAQPALPVVGSEALFPVRRIYCVGRNYAEHIKEMGLVPEREPPFFFDKPADTIVQNGRAIAYPPATERLSHEIELVVAIGKRAVDLTPENALDCVFGYAVGLDMTRRDLQLAARDRGRPWDTGKGFDESAPCGPITPAAKVGHPARGRIWLKVNGQSRQDADLGQLIWSVPEILSHLSRLYTLEAGDLVFTGTPNGVGEVSRGDELVGGIDGLETLTIRIAR